MNGLEEPRGPACAIGGDEALFFEELLEEPLAKGAVCHICKDWCRGVGGANRCVPRQHLEAHRGGGGKAVAVDAKGRRRIDLKDPEHWTDDEKAAFKRTGEGPKFVDSGDTAGQSGYTPPAIGRGKLPPSPIKPIRPYRPLRDEKAPPKPKPTGDGDVDFASAGQRRTMEQWATDFGKKKVEHLALVDDGGKIAARAEGTARRVELPGVGLTPPPRFTVIHNHPGADASLSAADLEVRNRPGLKGIIAVTPDGSWYKATNVSPGAANSNREMFKRASNMINVRFAAARDERLAGRPNKPNDPFASRDDAETLYLGIQHLILKRQHERRELTYSYRLADSHVQRHLKTHAKAYDAIMAEVR